MRDFIRDFGSWAAFSQPEHASERTTAQAWSAAANEARSRLITFARLFLFQDFVSGFIGAGVHRLKSHLDSRLPRHHGAPVRTTVTLEKDVQRLVRNAMHRSRRSFKETLNAAVRTGLSRKPNETKHVPFLVKAKPMGLRPGIDPGSLNQLADDLEVEGFVKQTKHRARS